MKPYQQDITIVCFQNWHLRRSQACVCRCYLSSLKWHWDDFKCHIILKSCLEILCSLEKALKMLITIGHTWDKYLLSYPAFQRKPPADFYLCEAWQKHWERFMYPINSLSAISIKWKHISHYRRPQTSCRWRLTSEGYDVYCISPNDRYKARYAYKPQHPDELEVSIGEVFTVYDFCSDGWFRGMSLSSGKTGVFPGNYMEPYR